MLRWILFLLAHVSADDSSCVLTLNAAAKTADMDAFNWDDRWLKSYEQQVYALGIKSVTAKLAELAVGGLAGEFASMFISIFFPPPGTKKEGILLKLVRQWTVNYVGQKEADLVRDLARVHLNSAEETLRKFYEPASAKLLAAVEEAKNFTSRLFRRPPIFPHDAWLTAESTLRMAWSSANTARNMILVGGSTLPHNTSRGQGLPTYIAAVTLCMSLSRQLYNITLLKDTWPHPWQGTSKESDRMVKQMKKEHKNYTEEIKTKMIEGWKDWRYSLVNFNFDHWSGHVYDNGDLHDELLDKTIHYPGVPGTDRSYGRHTETLYQRYLFANELVPMVRPFLSLIRIVPGWEKTQLTRGPLPEVVTIGPWSSLYATVPLNRYEDPPWADEAVRSTRRRALVGSDTVSSQGAIPPSMIKQLVFQEHDHDAIVRLPKKVEDAPLYKKAKMPRNTCGIDATYIWRGMSQFVAVNGDNQSEVWIGESLPTKRECEGARLCKALSTGTGLCGTYVWKGVSRVQKGGTNTGEAFEMEFTFRPDQMLK